MQSIINAFQSTQQLSYFFHEYVRYRLSIYGRKYSEWDTLAAWIVDNKLFSTNCRWLIQIPRLYDAYKETGT
jgi:AMP deaminase